MAEQCHTYRLPTGDRELLLDPPPRTWESITARNRSLTENWAFDVGGRAAAQLRAGARAELLELAAERANPGVVGETAGGGLLSRGSSAEPPSGVDSPIVLTGHQPLLYHPGVWVKTFLAERLAARLGGFALNTVVDSDSEEEIAVDVPSLPAGSLRGAAGLVSTAAVPYAPPGSGHRNPGGEPVRRSSGLARRREVLMKIPSGLPFEAVDTPTAAEFDEFCHRVLRHLAELPDAAPLRHFERFRRSGLAVRPLANNLSDFLTSARRHYEARYRASRDAGSVVVRDVPISDLTRGHSFRRFFLDIVWQAERFAAVYNDVLTEFRRARDIRSDLHPFPNLRVEPDEVELPFWLLAPDGRRHPLAVRESAPGRMAIGVSDGGGRFTRWAEGPLPPAGGSPDAAWWDEWESRLERVEIRPKAVPLTLFSRLFLSDVFIHGVGGGEYDRVTDALIERYYGVDPPTYIVASAALYLPLGSPEDGWDFGEWNEQKLRNDLRRMRYNPQAFVGAEKGRAGELARKKELLIRDMWTQEADRRALTREIEATNAALFELLAQRTGVKKMQAALSRATELNRHVEAVTWRGYPFACYHPELLRAVVEGAVGEERGEPRLTEHPPHCRV